MGSRTRKSLDDRQQSCILDWFIDPQVDVEWFGWFHMNLDAETIRSDTILCQFAVWVRYLSDASRNFATLRSEDGWPDRPVASSGHAYWLFYNHKKLLCFPKTPFSERTTSKRKVHIGNFDSKTEYCSENVESDRQNTVSDQSHSFLWLYHNQKVLGKIFWKWFCNFPGLLSVAKLPSKN